MCLSKVDHLLDAGKVAEAVTLLHDAASKDDTEAKFRLGMLYYSGEHVPHDFDRAWAWFEKADKDRHAVAPYYIGILCTSCGDHKVPTISEAREGKPAEEIALGWYNVAMSWFQRSANRGCHYAMTRIGYNYLHAIGVTQSDKKAYACFLRAKTAGNLKARLFLGKMLISGYGGPCGVIKGIFELMHAFYSVVKSLATEPIAETRARTRNW